MSAGSSAWVPLDLSESELREKRFSDSRMYADLSTVIVTPTRGGNSLSARWASCLISLIRPMNQKIFGPIFIEGMEVGAAYNHAIRMIQAHPDLSTFKYLLSLEDDVLPEPDALLKLYAGMEDYDAIGALYWTKGEGGAPMCYGQPGPDLNFRPFLPNPEGFTPCVGLGMGFTLFRMELFKEFADPWFETLQQWDPLTGHKLYTQDLNFFEKICKEGKRVACAGNAKAAHFDVKEGKAW